MNDSDTEHAQKPKRVARSRVCRVLSWIVVVVCTPFCLLWIFSGFWYRVDLLISQQSAICLTAFSFTLVLILGRQWRAGVVLLLFAILSAWPVVTGRLLYLPEVNFGQKPVGSVRVVSLNINPESEHWEEDFQALFELDADVIVLIEVPPLLNRSIRRNQRLANTEYSYWIHRSWVDQETSPGFIISRWPIEEYDTGLESKADQHVLHGKVQTAQGDLIVGLLHPLSPRSKQRWVLGNAVIDLQRDAIEQTILRSGLPMIVGADLNSGPAQQRGRTLKDSGLTMTKPLLRIGGSFPSNSNVPGVLRVQLDDVWCSPDLRPVAWSQVETKGSDHTMIIADVVIR